MILNLVVQLFWYLDTLYKIYICNFENLEIIAQCIIAIITLIEATQNITQ